MNITVKGENINKVTTCFKYRGEKIFYEISLKIAGVPYSVLFLRTDNHQEFRKVFQNLGDLRMENRSLVVPSLQRRTAKMLAFSAA